MVHHVQRAHDSCWADSAQAKRWLDDHNNGEQDVLAFSVAKMIPARKFAEEAEADGLWWSAALRWSAIHGKVASSVYGGTANLKKSVAAAEQAFPGLHPDEHFTQDAKDNFCLKAVFKILLSFDRCVRARRRCVCVCECV